MAVSFIRTIIFYTALVVFLRIMGKRQIGELQPSEFAVTLLIADLASVPMQASSIPIINGLIPIAVLLVLEMSISVLTMKFRKIRTIISGHPMTIIENGIIRQDIMKKLRFNSDDLCEELRLQGISNIENVNYAVIETNGKISVFTKSDDELYYAVISDGCTDKKVLQNLGITQSELDNIIKKHGFRNAKQIFLMCISRDRKIFIEGKK